MSSALQHHIIFPGPLNGLNKGAIDWGPQRLLAYASWSYIVLVDPYGMKRVQTLDQHTAPVRKVRFSREQLHLHNEMRYSLQLASGDQAGVIYIWKVLEATVSAALNTVPNVGLDGDEKRFGAVLDMLWVPDKPHLLVSLHNPSTLALWNVETSRLVWKYEFPEPLINLSLNPFDKHHLCVASHLGWIFFVRDFKEDAAPTRVDLKYKINSSRGTKAASTDVFQHMLFSPSSRNIAYFLLDRRLLVFDLSIHQAVGSITLERSRPAFRQVVLTKENSDLMFLLHEDGSLTAWVKKNPQTFHYDLVSSLDLLRMSKQTRKRREMAITGFSVSPFAEPNLMLALTSSDGVIWSVEWRPGVTSSQPGASTSSALWINGELEGVTSAVTSLSVYVPEAENLLHLTGLQPAPAPTTSENLAAIGTQDGRLLIVDLRQQNLLRTFTVMPNLPIRGTRWINANKLVCFTTDNVDKTSFKNNIFVVDIKTGQLKEVRKKMEAEETFIRGIRLSATKQYMVVLWKDHPFQLWELKTGSLLRTVTFSQITALEWSPNPIILPAVGANPASIREQFVFSTPDGALHYYAVENNQLTPIQMHVDVGIGIVSSLAWKDNLLVSGGTTGSIQCYNMEKKKLHVIETNKGLVRRIKFSPSNTSHQILVLFNDGDFGIWDIDGNYRVSVSTYFRARDLRAIDIDWVGENHPILATTDGCIRVVDKALSGGCNSPIQLSAISYPLHAPLLLPSTQALYLKAMLLHPELQRSHTQSQKAMEITGLADDYTLGQLVAAKNTAERALLVARYFGNTTEVRFWLLALDALQRKRRAINDNDDVDLSPPSTDTTPFVSPAPIPRNPVGVADDQTILIEEGVGINIGEDDVSADGEPTLSASALLEKSPTPPVENTDDIASATTNTELIEPKTTNASAALPAFFDLLLDPEQVGTMYRARSSMHEQRKGGNHHLTQKIIDFNLVVGQKEKAMEMLLETPSSNPQFFIDALKACIVAASINPASFGNTVKLVATNLIANGALDEGVQLLCLIGRSLDACRYLQSYDRWNEAALLAKLTLSKRESAQVFRRWSDFLVANNQLFEAIEIELTLCDWSKVLYLLQRAHLFDIAAMFSKAIKEFDFMTAESDLAQPSPAQSNMTMSQLLESIHMDYAMYLNRIGYRKAAKYYYENSTGELGLKMLQEMKSSEAKTTVIVADARNLTK